MNGSQLLAIGGYATSGKDALADILVEELGWYKTYMSKPLEQALLTLDPFVGINAEAGAYIRYSAFHAAVGYDETKKNFEVRRLLQTLGTEIGRDMFSPNVWVDLVRMEASKQLDNDKNVVVTGIRYPNELSAFRSLGGRSVWVERPGVSPVNSHSSDNTLDHHSFDIWVPNYGSLEDLRAWTIERFKD